MWIAKNKFLVSEYDQDNFKREWESLSILLKDRSFLIHRPGAGLRVCTTHESPGNTDAAGPRTHLEEQCSQRHWHQHKAWDVPWQEAEVLNGPLMVSSTQYNLPFILSMKNLKREQKGGAVLKEWVQGGMPRPHILHERKEGDLRGRNWDHQSKKTHRCMLKWSPPGSNQGYSHLVTDCGNMWWESRTIPGDHRQEEGGWDYSENCYKGREF